ncbi:MAG: rpe [Solirubrobacterales bacterium]|nr:rpe [Solirubrobacterales bacterium]
MPAPRIAPSILSADFGRLRAQVEEIIGAGASVIHIDVMDGHFVPPLSMGPPVVSALRELGAMLDVHLMVERPERQVADFASAGADQITIHAEATPHVHYALAAIRDAGCKAGLALNPGTPVGALEGVELDCAVVMTVNPGWGGQAFIPTSLEKVRRVRELVGPDVDVEVDGGVDARTAGPCAEAGATLFVAGSAIFGQADPAAAYAAIAAAAGAS